MPPSTTPHMPGTSASSAPFITWQVEVPMMATILPGATGPAAGTVTCASTLPTATAMPRGKPASAAAERGDRVGELVLGERGEARVQRGQVLPGGITAVLVDALVPGRARVPGLGAAQPPDDPVGSLDPPVGPLVDLRVLIQQL